jgi:hypothetical protein
VILIIVEPDIVWSLGLDPRHHEELHNGPEMKFHICKAVLGFQKSLGFFQYCIKKVLEGRGPILGPTYPYDPHGPVRGHHGLHGLGCHSPLCPMRPRQGKNPKLTLIC